MIVIGALCIVFPVLLSYSFFNGLSSFGIKNYLFYGGIIFLVIGFTIKGRRGASWGVGTIVTIAGVLWVLGGVWGVFFIWFFLYLFGAALPVSIVIIGLTVSGIGLVLIIIGTVLRKKADSWRKSEQEEQEYNAHVYNQLYPHCGLPPQNGLRAQYYCPRCGNIMADTGYRQGADGKLYTTEYPNGRICYECPACGHVEAV